jgi:type II secretory pathway pseudopilin PulG
MTEILVVMAIISMLASLLLGGVMLARTKARKDQTKVILSNIAMALGNYRTDVGDFPPGKGDLASSEALCAALTSAQGFGPYLQKGGGTEVRDTNGNGAPELVDAWANPIYYKRGELLAEDKDFELRSAGPDGVYGTDDDIVM